MLPKCLLIFILLPQINLINTRVRGKRRGGTQQDVEWSWSSFVELVTIKLRDKPFRFSELVANWIK